MPYREVSEKPPEVKEPTSDLVCSECNVPVAPATTEDESPRCPKCLRKTTVVHTRGVRRATIGVDRDEGGNTNANANAEHPAKAVWPASITCPVCARAEISEARVFLRVSKTASDFGSRSETLFFSVRTCDACLTAVRRHDTSRYVTAVALVLGLVMLFGVFTRDNVGLAIAVVGAVLGMGGFGSFVVRNRRLRQHIDAAGWTEALAAQLPSPSGLFEWGNASLHGSPPTQHPVRDLAEALGEEPAD